MRNIKLTIEYDGTGYHGWQSQINAAAVQDVLEAAVRKLTGEENGLTGSSRTDTGVHALGFVANFHTASQIPADKFAFALNSMLPADIVIRSSEEADADFHSRFSAKGKRYRYLVHNSMFPSALLRHRAWHVFYQLDIAAMQEGAKYILGTHDFKAFMAAGSDVKSTIRTIGSILVNYTDLGADTGAGIALYNTKEDCTQEYHNEPKQDSPQIAQPTPLDLQKNCQPSASEKLISLDISGNGFLYNMVRIIAGTLVQVGYGKLRPEEVPKIIEDGDRKKAGKTAPAHGLYLVEVFY